MKALALFAHIEDHICFGWPLMQDDTVEKHLIVCTNDGQGVLQKSCKDANIHLVETLGFPNGFHRNTAAVGTIAKRISEVLDSAIKEIKPDFLFTHNPWGEYGHFDHQLVFQVVYGQKVPILITDIVADSVCFPKPKTGIYRTLCTELHTTVESDYDFYSRQRDIFKEFGLWTHNQYLDKPYYPPKTVKLYKITDER